MLAYVGLWQVFGSVMVLRQSSELGFQGGEYSSLISSVEKLCVWFDVMVTHVLA